MAFLFGTSGNNNILGTIGDDVILGYDPVVPFPDGNDTINGNAGNDLIYGGDGNDSLIGGTGTDTINGGNGNDRIRSDGDGGIYNGDAGNDVMYSGLGNETMDGGTGIDLIDHSAFGGDYVFNMTTGLTNFAGELYNNFENVIMGAGNDTVTGNASANVINGGNGNDSLIGGAGTDTLNGGNGNDIIRSDGDGGTYRGDAGNDLMYSGLGAETMDGGVGIDRIDHSAFGGNYVFNMATGLTNFGGELYTNFENATMGAGNDSVLGNASDNSISGGSGNDTLNGGSGNDILLGGIGNDSLDGSYGNDVIDGGTGFDIMYGGVGNDTYYVDATGEFASDGVYEYVNEGIDTIISSVSYFIDYSIWVENLILTGTAGFGYGNNLNNTIIGNRGNNNLWGNSGSDSLSGGIGNDQLNGYGYSGSSEYDTLTGGAGGDTFVLGNSFDSFYDPNGTYSTDGYAIITDFKHSVYRGEGDKLQLNGNASLYTESDVNWGIGTSALDTAVYKGGDLIAVLQDVSGGNFILSLDSIFV